MKITYDEYDRMEEICDYMHEQMAEDVMDIDSDHIFYMTMQRPTLEQLKVMDIEHHFEDYFEYLFFYYTQDFTEELQGDLDELEEYKSMKAYLRSVFDKKIEFVDEDELEED